MMISRSLGKGSLSNDTGSAALETEPETDIPQFCLHRGLVIGGHVNQWCKARSYNGPEISPDDRVIVNVDSMCSAQLVNRKQFYVSISWERHDTRVYTDDAEALRRAVSRSRARKSRSSR
jgi:hypothetical protein